jgi:fatty acid desaturase
MHTKHPIEWADLLKLSRFDVVIELTISLPWLLASWWVGAHGYTFIALGCSFMFFLTGLRQVHNAYHHALGISRIATHGVMFVLSVLMLGSMHAVRFNHLRHHRHCMEENDIEAMSARMPWWQALLIGPLFPFLLHTNALKLAAPTQRRWIMAELFANVLWVLGVMCVFDVAWLKYHVIAMAVGQCFTAFFAVWTVHHDCGSEGTMSRTIRGDLKAFVTYSMFFHAEHHMFPAVPTCKLSTLARRLDAVVPESACKHVF